MATIKDIAREAGVGVGTVSRHLNGVLLKPVTALKVQAAIDRLGFTLNPVARGLKTSRSLTVGVVIPDFADIYGGTMIKHLERGLSAHGYSLLACDSSGDPGREAEKVRQMLHRRVDGLILYPCGSDVGYLASIPELVHSETAVPVLTVDMKTEGFACDQVRTDNRGATREATRWLISRGYVRIGLVTGPAGYFTAEERKDGYLEALAEAGIPVDGNLIRMTPHFDDAGGREAIGSLLELREPPKAVLACNYYTTLGAVQAIHDRNLRMPDNLALIGFDNLGLSAMVHPPLTIIVQPMEEIGASAADLLIRRMRGDRSDFPIVLQKKTTLLLRGSA